MPISKTPDQRACGLNQTRLLRARSIIVTSLDALKTAGHTRHGLFLQFVQGTLSVTAEKSHLCSLLCLAHDGWPALHATQHFINTAKNAVWITACGAVVLILVPHPFL